LKLPSAKRQAVNLTVVVTTLGAIDFVVDSSDSKTKKRRKQRERKKRKSHCFDFGNATKCSENDRQ
jgi:hypothetical protein